MGVFVRAVITGFGFSLGSALYKRVSEKLGLGEGNSKTPDPDTADGEDDETLDEDDG